MVFQMLLWKGGFYLKKESLGFIFIKVMETLLDNKSDNFKFLTSFSLDVRAWSTETPTNIASVLYSRVWTHSVPLVSLYTHWKYLSFFDVFRESRKRHVTWSGFKDSQKQPYANVLQSVLKNFAIFKGKHLSWSLFLIKLQASSPVALLKRDSNLGIFLWILRNF